MQQNKEKLKSLIADVMAQGDVSSKLANLTILINFWIIAIPLEENINPGCIISCFWWYALFWITWIVHRNSIVQDNRPIICLLYVKEINVTSFIFIYSKILSKMCWFRVHFNLTYGPYTLCSEVIFQSLSSSSNKSRDLTHKTDHVLS